MREAGSVPDDRLEHKVICCLTPVAQKRPTPAAAFPCRGRAPRPVGRNLKLAGWVMLRSEAAALDAQAQLLGSVGEGEQAALATHPLERIVGNQQMAVQIQVIR